LREIVPFDQLHDEGVNAVRLFETVDVRDIRMVQRGERLGFAREPPQAIRIVGKGGWKDLHCDIAVKPGITSPIDLAHTTHADLRGDLVRAEDGALSQGHGVWRGLYG